MFDSLRSVSDQQILTTTDAIIVHERKLTLRLLQHLHEIERRKLYLKRGHGSMFDYCTTRLRLSEPAAVRRIRTERCLARFPRLHPFLESGEVNLTTVSLVARILNADNFDAVLARIRGKSKRAVEAVVAEFEPRTTLPRDSVRPVVVFGVSTPVAPSVSTAPFLPAVTVAGDGKNSASVETEVENDCVADAHADSRPCTNGATLDRRMMIQFSAAEEFMELFDHVRSLSSHQLPPHASFEQVFAFVLRYYVAHEDPRVRHERREAQKREGDSGLQIRSRAGTESSRAIPARVRDAVFARDGGQCTYTAPGGRRCASTHVLQVDHVRPVARGGASTPDNLRLLCAHHNRLEARRVLGNCGPPQ